MTYYYGYIIDSFGFVDKDSEYYSDKLIEVSDAKYEQLMEETTTGKEIVYYNNEIFAADPDYYYVDENHQWQQRTQEEVDEIRRQRRAEYLAKLSLTKREVFLALYADKGVTPEQLEAQITDPAALIEFKYAERYFRGNALIDLIGQRLGYTSQQLDNLFENGSF